MTGAALDLADGSGSESLFGRSSRPRLLDLFCGAGGATKGYQRAGFYVVGVDLKPQPNYCGDAFVQADALLLDWHFEAFDAIHASPPCQKYSRTQRLRGRHHPDLIAPTRDMLEASGRPYVIENVPEAPLRRDLVLCGTMFDLREGGFELRRHRVFESSVALLGQPCRHRLPSAPVFGHSPNSWFRTKYGQGFTNEQRRRVMGTPWIGWDEIGEAIPPAFTTYIGEQLLAHVREPVAA